MTLTPQAIARIKELQQTQKGVFYIGVRDAGCNGKKYVVDMIPQPNLAEQEAIKMNDVEIYVDKNSVPYLQGLQLDCINKGLGMWIWDFKNPNAKGSCGCGESFSVEK